MKNNRPERLEKVLWPEKGYTKRDLLAYYEKIAPILLPYLKDRPIALSRYPDGIKGVHFFQKDLGSLKLPGFVKTVSIRAASTGKTVRYALCQNKETLLYLAGLGSIEMHPFASRVGSLRKPDYLIFDIDPGSASSFEDVVRVAQEFRRILDGLGVSSACKTSGKRGLHVYAALGARYTYPRVRAFALRVSRQVNERLPEITTLEQRIPKRKGRVYLDYTRNSAGQTMACAYSLRPTPEATVSAPLEWREVKPGLDPKRFTIKTIFKRVKDKGDAWRPVLGKPNTLPQSRRK
jgi:bifunctional non-homologous end joining protein LigD